MTTRAHTAELTLKGILEQVRDELQTRGEDTTKVDLLIQGFEEITSA